MPFLNDTLAGFIYFLLFFATFVTKQVRIQIYPGDDYTLMYNLYPLLSGFVALPPIQLRPSTSIDPSDGEFQSPLDADTLDELVARYVPTHIYVLV